MRTSTPNEHYKKIRELGFTLDATTSNKNSGMLHLLQDGVRIHSEPFKTNGRGTVAVLEALPTTYRYGHLSRAMEALLKWIAAYEFQPAPGAPDPFVEQYNATIATYAPFAFRRVNEELEKNPDLTFEQLFRIWSVEVQYMIKTKNRDFATSYKGT